MNKNIKKKLIILKETEDLGTLNERITLAKYASLDELTFKEIMILSEYNVLLEKQIKLINIYENKKDENIYKITNLFLNRKSFSNILEMVEKYDSSIDKEATLKLIFNEKILLNRTSSEHLNLLSKYNDICKTEAYMSHITISRKYNEHQVSKFIYGKIIDEDLLEQDANLQEKALDDYLEIFGFNVINFDINNSKKSIEKINKKVVK